MRHGYYLAAQQLLRGEHHYALAAQAFYREVLGLDSTYACRYDGISIYDRPDGSVQYRVVLQNFFTDRLDVHIHDYPYEEKL